MLTKSMKKLSRNILSAIFVIFIGSFFSSCQNAQNETANIKEDNIPVINPSGFKISNLEVGKIVKFPAVLAKSYGNTCAEIFTQEEYKKYNGDSKWAVTAKFKNEPSFIESLLTGKNVMITGKMTFVRDSKDTNNTCRIITGHIFEIIEIEELKND